jgi:sporulation protein YabP
MAGDIAETRQEHSVSIDNRKRILVTGIREVTSYDSSAIVAASPMGELIVQGKKLHINSFDQGTGRLSVDGDIDAVQYVDIKTRGESFFSRLLK